MKILLVDNEPFQLKLLTRQLAALGQTEVQACASGREALDWMGASPQAVELIMLDLSMPGMDGVEFLRHLVGLNYTGALALVSGEDERILETAGRLARAHHLNVLGILNKPVQPAALEALLTRWRDEVPRAARREVKSYGAEELKRPSPAVSW